MVFFVRKIKHKNNIKNKNTIDNIALGWILIGKKIGFSLEELNCLTVNSLSEMADLFFNVDTEREATQDDIDSFFK